MSGPLDTIDWRPESAAGPATPQADTRDPTGQVPGPLAMLGPEGYAMAEEPVVAASFRTALDDAQVTQNVRLDNAYDPVVAALSERTGLPKSHWRRPWYEKTFDPTLAHSSTFDPDAIWRDVSAARQADPKAFADLGDRAAFEKQVLTRQGARAQDMDLLGRSRGLPAAAAQFAGGFAPSMLSPINLATLPIGGGFKSIATRILGEGVLNAGVAAATIPERQAALARMGEAYTGEQQLADVGTAFAFGATVRGAIEAVPRVASLFSEAVPEHLRTPDEQAAVDVLEREDQVEQASPFARTYQGDDLHARKLSEALDNLADGRIAPEGENAPGAPAPAPAAGSAPSAAPRPLTGIVGTLSEMLERGGLAGPQARGVAAGLYAESGGRIDAVNPASGAFGLGQWLGPRKAELVRRFGPNPTLEQQVEFVLHELHGGDPGGAKVLAQGDEASALRSFVEDFLRPAKGHETDGDLARGMAALGRDGETPPAAAGGGFGDGLDQVQAALGEEGAAVDAERAGLARDDASAAPPDASAQIPQAPELPQLDRSLFDNATDWRLAQAESDARATATDPAADLLYRLRQVVADREAGGSLTPTDRLAADLQTTPQALRQGLQQLAGLGEVRQQGDRWEPTHPPALRPGEPFAAAPPPREPLRDNYLGDLGDFTPRVWRETSLDDAELFLPTGNASADAHTRGDLFFADTPDLALGQGDNRGVTMEFDAAGLQGNPSFTKPSARHAWEQGLGSEFVARHNNAALYKQRLRAIRVSTDAKARPAMRERMRRVLERLERSGWLKTEGPGYVQYVRPPRRLEGAAADAADELGLRGDPVIDPKVARAFDSDAGEGVKAAAESDWHDIRAAEKAAARSKPSLGGKVDPETNIEVRVNPDGSRTYLDHNPGGQAYQRFGKHDPAAELADVSQTAAGWRAWHASQEFDLEDGKGPRTAGEIDAEIQADKAALEEIRKCLK